MRDVAFGDLDMLGVRTCGGQNRIEQLLQRLVEHTLDHQVQRADCHSGNDTMRQPPAQIVVGRPKSDRGDIAAGRQKSVKHHFSVGFGAIVQPKGIDREVDSHRHQREHRSGQRRKALHPAGGAERGNRNCGQCEKRNLGTARHHQHPGNRNCRHRRSRPGTPAARLRQAAGRIDLHVDQPLELRDSARDSRP